MLPAGSGPEAEMCADTHAHNYSPEATSVLNCLFPVVDINPRLQATLPKEVKETSGLAWIDGYLLTHNDRNNQNKLYVIDPATGRLCGSISVKGAVNNDWEDLAQSDEHLFIGDMGNNGGDRRDLQIYKVKKSALQFKGEQEVEPEEIISFRYPEQQDFSGNKDHNFDSEALIYHDGFLYLFTKNRGDKNSSLYKIPAEGGKYDAALIGTFHAGGKITGAAINDRQQVALIGFNKKEDCFIWLLEDYSGDNFFSGKKTRMGLGAFKSIGQTEGLVFTSPNKLFISSEKVGDLSPRLYTLALP